MTRTSQNPNKTAIIQLQSKVVALVITHLPEMESEYHKDRFEVIKFSIESLIHGLDRFIPFIFWDNGSCRKFTEYLTTYSRQQATVILSPNIGKTNALKSAMRMLPPDTILAYGDDDIEYFHNWLQPQIDILETYPNVGTVTGWPTRLESRWGESSIKKLLGEHKRKTQINSQFGNWIVEQGRFIPDEWEYDYCQSLGRDWPTHQLNTRNDVDYQITHKGVSAYATSHHCQFVCYPERVESLIPWTDKAMDNERVFDDAVDNAGLLRLATVDRLTRHLGNKLD